MPTYDYRCRSCGTVTEVIHAMLDDGPTVCELCGGVLRRVIHASGIIFKGSGFYRNDSRASSSSSIPPGEKGSASEKGSESGSGSGADSTPSSASGSERTGSETKKATPESSSS
ncbi:MAG: FmdB family zinc ribbon protein [Candidatus Limnocylindria bacterium]